MNCDEKNTYLLSYPRSGNTWMRYIIEFLSKRPTQGYGDSSDKPIGERLNIGVNIKAKPIAIKAHILYDAYEKKTGKLILIVRDYKEAITRHAQYGGIIKSADVKRYFDNCTKGYQPDNVDYMEPLLRYDKLQIPKVLVYYEDLLNKDSCVSACKSLINLLEIDDKYLSSFAENFEKHKKQSVSAHHAGSATKGNSLIKHQKDTNLIKYMDNSIKNKFPEIFEKYLKRYSSSS